MTLIRLTLIALALSTVSAFAADNDKCIESKAACMKGCDYEGFGCDGANRSRCMTKQFDCRVRCTDIHPGCKDAKIPETPKMPPPAAPVVSTSNGACKAAHLKCIRACSWELITCPDTFPNSPYCLDQQNKCLGECEQNYGVNKCTDSNVAGTTTKQKATGAAGGGSVGTNSAGQATDAR